MANTPEVFIKPNHGAREATITWSAPTGWEDSEVYIYYSKHGVTNSWAVLNGTAPVDNNVSDSYTDTDFVISNKSQRGYYRVALRRNIDGLWLDSYPYGIYQRLTDREHGILRIGIMNEIRDARFVNGIPMWHFLPRTEGELSDHIDPDSGQVTGVDCPDVAPEDDSYGQKYKGGFYKPCLTWVRMRASKVADTKDRSDGLGTEDPTVHQCRFLPFPELRRGHLFVDPQTDNRYWVGENVRSYLLRGIAPLAWEGTLELIDRNNPVYRLPTPDFTWEEFRNARGHMNVVTDG